jgi:hypothetical protein
VVRTSNTCPRQRYIHMLSCIASVLVVVGPVRDEHRRGVESHAAPLRKRWYAKTADLEVNGANLILGNLATANFLLPL